MLIATGVVRPVLDEGELIPVCITLFYQLDREYSDAGLRKGKRGIKVGVDGRHARPDRHDCFGSKYLHAGVSRLSGFLTGLPMRRKYSAHPAG